MWTVTASVSILPTQVIKSIGAGSAITNETGAEDLIGIDVT